MCIYLCVYIQFQKHEYKFDRYTHIYKYTLSYISIYIYTIYLPNLDKLDGQL